MSKIADTEANATSLDGLVNDNALVPTLRNGPKPSYQYLVDGWNTEFDALISSLDNQGDTAINAINADVLTVENAKNSAISNINADVSAVDTARNSALDYINDAKVEVTSKVYDFNAIADTAISNFELESSNSIADFEEESQAAIIEMQKSRGFRRVGTFEDGFTYELANDVGIDSSGESWVLTDISSLPFTVPAMTTPTDGVYTKVTYNSADNVINDKGGSVQDYIDYNLKVEDVNELTSLSLDDSFIGSVIKTSAFNLNQQLGWAAKSGSVAGGANYRVMSKTDADSDGVVYWESGDLEGHYAFLVGDYVLIISGNEVNASQFGALPITGINSTYAFQAASKYLSNIGGGKLVIPAGEYTVGIQTVNTSSSSPYYQDAGNSMDFIGCSGLVVEFQGAKISTASGLRFGAFNPASGEPATVQTSSAAYSNTPNNIMRFFQCDNITIINPNLDGNLDNLIIGGGFGDTGIQIPHSGIRLESCSKYTVLNPTTNNFGLDGLYLTRGGAHNATIINHSSFGNGRQGCSLVGGTDVTFINPIWADTGRGQVYSLPGAGLDIEPNFQEVDNIHIINPSSYNNTGPALLSLIPDKVKGVTVSGGVLASTGSGRSVWDETGVRFSGVRIIGNVVKTHDKTVFEGVTFTDEEYKGYVPTDNLLEGVAELTAFNDCDINLVNSADSQIFVQGGVFNNVRYNLRLTNPSPSARVGVLVPTKVTDLIINDEYVFTNGNTGTNVSGSHTYIDTSGMDFENSTFGSSRFVGDNVAVGSRSGDTNVYIGKRSVPDILSTESFTVTTSGDGDTFEHLLPTGINLITLSSGTLSRNRITWIVSSFPSGSNAQHSISELVGVRNSIGTGTIEMIPKGGNDAIKFTEGSVSFNNTVWTVTTRPLGGARGFSFI